MPRRMRCLGNGFAREIEGMDLWQSFSEAEIEEIRTQWRQHAALVFQRQSLSAAELLRFSARFGAAPARSCR